MIFHEGGKTVGRNFNVVDDDVARKAMEAAGFVDIQEYTYKVCAVLPIKFCVYRTDSIGRTQWGAGRRIPF